MHSHNKRYVHHHGWGCVGIYYLSHWLWIHKLKFLALAAKYLNILAFRVYIDPPATIGDRLVLPHGGFGVVIAPDVEIGCDAIIMHNVTIGHARPGRIIIGNRFCAGAGATILGPVRIGHDVTIGANATVHFDVPDGATVVGQRARIITPNKLGKMAGTDDGREVVGST